MKCGDWGLGIGDWGLGIGPNPQSPISLFYLKINIFISFFINLNNYYIIKNDEKTKYSKNKQRIICDNN